MAKAKSKSVLKLTPNSKQQLQKLFAAKGINKPDCNADDLLISYTNQQVKNRKIKHHEHVLQQSARDASNQLKLSVSEWEDEAHESSKRKSNSKTNKHRLEMFENAAKKFKCSKEIELDEPVQTFPSSANSKPVSKHMQKKQIQSEKALKHNANITIKPVAKKPFSSVNNNSKRPTNERIVSKSHMHFDVEDLTDAESDQISNSLIGEDESLSNSVEQDIDNFNYADFQFSDDEVQMPVEKSLLDDIDSCDDGEWDSQDDDLSADGSDDSDGEGDEHESDEFYDDPLSIGENATTAEADSNESPTLDAEFLDYDQLTLSKSLLDDIDSVDDGEWNCKDDDQSAESDEEDEADKLYNDPLMNDENATTETETSPERETELVYDGQDFSNGDYYIDHELDGDIEHSDSDESIGPVEPIVVSLQDDESLNLSVLPLEVDAEANEPFLGDLEISTENIFQSIAKLEKSLPTKRTRKPLNVSRKKFMDLLDEDETPADECQNTTQPEQAAHISQIDTIVEGNATLHDANETEQPNASADDGQQPHNDSTVLAYDQDIGDDFQTKTGQRPRFFNALNSRQVLLVLHAELQFHGILDVHLIRGGARINGYDIPLAQTVRAFSPRGQSFISISPVVVPAAEPIVGSREALSAIAASMLSDFLRSDIEEALGLLEAQKGSALLMLEAGDRRSNAFAMLDKYMRQAIFPNCNAFNVQRTLYSTEYVLRTQFYTRPKTKLIVNGQWRKADLAARSDGRTMVIGGKGVGKSTYMRWLVNQTVQRHGACMLIDLDIGQPELFVPQCISASCVREPILGAGYMHGRRPDRALLFGELNVTIAPLKYLRCALRLLRDCAAHEEWSGLPWIVNTMGYCRGFGLEMTAAILRAVHITDVVQIQSQRYLDNFEHFLTAEFCNGHEFRFFRTEVGADSVAAHKTHVMRSMARKFGEKSPDWDMSAKDMRMATVLAHLGSLLSDGSEWLTDIRPVCAPLDGLKVIVANDTVDPEHLLDLLNGNLVYLCSKPDGSADDQIECYGIGVVRGVDRQQRTVYLLPAVDRTQLGRVNCLAVCNAPLPASLITSHSARIRGRIPFAYQTDDFIGSKQIVKISYRPDFTPKKDKNDS